VAAVASSFSVHGAITLGIAPAAYLVCRRSSFSGEQVRIAVKFASNTVRRSMTMFSDSIIQVSAGILSSNTIHEDMRRLPRPIAGQDCGV